jgi:hypothetical protein
MAMKQSARVHRQGDVLLIPTTKRPSAAAKRVTDHGRVILAYGEVTGHAHEVVPIAPNAPSELDPVAPCELFEEADGTRILVLSRPSVVKHDEHGADALDGDQAFEIRQQCEWSLDEVRQVAD